MLSFDSGVSRLGRFDNIDLDNHIKEHELPVIVDQRWDALKRAIVKQRNKMSDRQKG
jgi:hypothetical protein